MMRTAVPHPVEGPDRRSTACLLVLACVLAGSAAAREDRPDPTAALVKAALKRFDADGDGVIARREWTGDEAVFTAFDANKDGKVSEAELRKQGALLAMHAPAIAMAPRLVPLRERFETVPASTFDKDLNGLLSEREFSDYVFALGDQNDGGGIDEAEADYLAKWPPYHVLFEGKARRFMQRMDSNGDGKVEPREFKLDGSIFKMHDRDRSGSLSAAELDPEGELGFEAFANQNPDSLLERFDANKDGKLSGGELPGGARSVFNRADGDKDGQVTRDELAKVMQYARDNQFARLEPDFVARFDLNGDKKVNRSEFPGTDAAFARLDGNGDGYVTRADGTP